MSRFQWDFEAEKPWAVASRVQLVCIKWPEAFKSCSNLGNGV